MSPATIEHAGAADEQQAGERRGTARVGGDADLHARARAVSERQRPLEPGGTRRRGLPRAVDRLQAHQHPGRLLDLVEQAAVDRAADHEPAAVAAPRRGEHERLVLARAARPGDGLAGPARPLEQRLREREPRPREPPVAGCGRVLVDDRRERQPLALRERHQLLLGRPAPGRDAVLAHLGHLGREALLDGRELPVDQMARGLGLGAQLAIHGRARDERGADGRERHHEREREGERDQRLRAQGQCGSRNNRRGRGRSPPEAHVQCVGADGPTSIASGRLIERPSGGLVGLSPINPPLVVHRPRRSGAPSRPVARPPAPR